MTKIVADLMWPVKEEAERSPVFWNGRTAMVPLVEVPEDESWRVSGQVLGNRCSEMRI